MASTAPAPGLPWHTLTVGLVGPATTMAVSTNLMIMHDMYHYVLHASAMQVIENGVSATDSSSLVFDMAAPGMSDPFTPQAPPLPDKEINPYLNQPT